MENITQQLAAVAAKIAVVESEIEDCKKEVADAKMELKSAVTEREWQIATLLLNCAVQQRGDLNVQLHDLNEKEKQLRSESYRLLISVSSCHSNTASGRCPTGMHVRRDGRNQRVFKEELLRRDQKCIATGELDRKVLIAAHIIPVSRSETIDRDDVYHLRNGVLLRQDLEEQYDRFEWYFDECGQVKVLFNGWPHKNFINTVSISPNDGPGADLIVMHNEHAEGRAVHHCPDCWKLVGIANIVKHRESSGGSCIYCQQR